MGQSGAEEQVTPEVEQAPRSKLPQRSRSQVTPEVEVEQAQRLNKTRQGRSGRMNDLMRESLSYFGLYRKMFQVKRKYRPVKISYGRNKEQYFLYYEPTKVMSDKIIVWAHGGGWNVLFLWATDCLRNTNTPARLRMSVRHIIQQSAICGRTGSMCQRSSRQDRRPGRI